MKPLVIYHKACADGFGAAFAAWLKLGDEAEYVPMYYGKETEQFSILENGEFDSDFTILNREIFILDFSFPRWIMEGLFDLTKRVVWLDHHKTAFEMWCQTERKYFCNQEILPDVTRNHYIKLDNNKSGAMLAWEYFHPDTEVPMLIRHIDDYDRWVFALKGTKEINKALWSFTPWTFPLWQEIIDDDQYGSMWSQGSAILRAHNQNVQSVVKGAARKCEIPFNEEAALDCVEPCLEWNDDGYWMVQGLAANCPPHLTSDVGHELANQSGTFGLLWTLDKNNVCKCSLRSNGDYDVSAIAKAFGGGGHRNAAGFQVDIQTLLRWIG